ncbi:MAG: hypothetical protein PHG19_07640 [Anaerotignum sp.]|nr:hypothetical protein [Anaerotignum sp.]
MKIIKIITTLFVLVVLLSSCGSNGSDKEQKQISKELGIDVSDGTVMKSSDTHGGFHGDGTTFIELSFSDENCLEEIKKNSDWKQLPLTDNLTALVYGKVIGQTSEGPYLTDENSDTLFPKIQNGYYYFCDTHTESVNHEDDSDVLNRYSFNFTIAIYDNDTEILYFSKFGT